MPTLLKKNKKSEVKKKKENKKSEKKREKKKESIYIQKGGLRKEGSENELAGSTYIKGCFVCTPSSCGITLQQKNISPPAPPNFTLACLQSLAITLIRC